MSEQRSFSPSPEALARAADAAERAHADWIAAVASGHKPSIEGAELRLKAAEETVRHLTAGPG